MDPLDGSDPLHLNSDGEGDWRDASGRALPELQGCIDVDLPVDGDGLVLDYPGIFRRMS